MPRMDTTRRGARPRETPSPWQMAPPGDVATWGPSRRSGVFLGATRCHRYLTSCRPFPHGPIGPNIVFVSHGESRFDQEDKLDGVSIILSVLLWWFRGCRDVPILMGLDGIRTRRGILSSKIEEGFGLNVLGIICASLKHIPWIRDLTILSFVSFFGVSMNAACFQDPHSLSLSNPFRSFFLSSTY